MGLKEELLKEQERLKNILEKTEKSLEGAPEGTLRLGGRRGIVQYYHRLPGGPKNGTYLAKQNMELARLLAQKTYDRRIIKCAGKRFSQIGEILRDYENNEIENCYLCQHPERQKLIIPAEPTYTQMLEDWITKPYVGKGFKEDSPVILTNKGLRVRSKSEKIMADYFDSLGILFKYECPLYLKTYGNVYPDFTFLSPHTRQEIYWEHEGMMDSPEYARSAVKKIELYENNGIYPGERLILSFETVSSVLNTTILQTLTKTYLQ